MNDDQLHSHTKDKTYDRQGYTDTDILSLIKRLKKHGFGSVILLIKHGQVKEMQETKTLRKVSAKI